MTETIRTLRATNAYIDLVAPLTVASSDGLFTLYMNHLGSTDVVYPMKKLKSRFSEVETSGRLQDALTEFSKHAIISNLARYGLLALDTCRDPIKHLRDGGDIEDIAMPSPATIKAAKAFIGSCGDDTKSLQLTRNSIENLAAMCGADTTRHYGATKQTVSVPTLVNLYRALRSTLNLSATKVGRDYKAYHLPAAKTAVALGCLLNGISSEAVTEVRESPDLSHLTLTDTTLASLPSVDIGMLRLCQDQDAGPISSRGMIYILRMSQLYRDRW